MVYVKMVNEKGKEKFKFRFFLFWKIEQYVFHDRFEQKPISHKYN